MYFLCSFTRTHTHTHKLFIFTFRQQDGVARYESILEIPNRKFDIFFLHHILNLPRRLKKKKKIKSYNFKIWGGEGEFKILQAWFWVYSEGLSL